MGVYISRIWGEETPLRIEPNFFLVKDIHEVIKHDKFGDDRLRGSGVVAGQISAFLIDFAGRPYNTLTLPCERVITCVLFQSNSLRGFVNDSIICNNSICVVLFVHVTFFIQL